VSSISIWEVGLKIKNKKLDIGMRIQQYVEKLKQLGAHLQTVPIDESLWITNLELPWEHKDHADRTIVATAHLFDAWIVTTDQEIQSYYKKIYWPE
jgi:PIN domain nuclease of toxin-antitoxin system